MYQIIARNQIIFCRNTPLYFSSVHGGPNIQRKSTEVCLLRIPWPVQNTLYTILADSLSALLGWLSSFVCSLCSWKLEELNLLTCDHADVEVSYTQSSQRQKQMLPEILQAVNGPDTRPSRKARNKNIGFYVFIPCFPTCNYYNTLHDPVLRDVMFHARGDTIVLRLRSHYWLHWASGRRQMRHSIHGTEVQFALTVHLLSNTKNMFFYSQTLARFCR